MKNNINSKKNSKLVITLIFIPVLIVFLITTFLISKAYSNADTMQLSLPFHDAYAKTEDNDLSIIKDKQKQLKNITNQSVNESNFDLTNIFEKTSDNHEISNKVYKELKDTYYLSLKKGMNALNKNNVKNSTSESFKENIEEKNLEHLRKNVYYGEDITKGWNHNSTVKEIAKEERLPEYESLKSDDISNNQIKGEGRFNTGFKPYNDSEEQDNKTSEE